MIWHEIAPPPALAAAPAAVLRQFDYYCIPYVYIYIYICIHTYIYTYMYIYI